MRFLPFAYQCCRPPTRWFLEVKCGSRRVHHGTCGLEADDFGEVDNPLCSPPSRWFRDFRSPDVQCAPPCRWFGKWSKHPALLSTTAHVVWKIMILVAGILLSFPPHGGLEVKQRSGKTYFYHHTVVSERTVCIHRVLHRPGGS